MNIRWEAGHAKVGHHVLHTCTVKVMARHQYRSPRRSRALHSPPSTTAGCSAAIALFSPSTTPRGTTPRRHPMATAIPLICTHELRVSAGRLLRPIVTSFLAPLLDNTHRQLVLLLKFCSQTRMLRWIRPEVPHRRVLWVCVLAHTFTPVTSHNKEILPVAMSMRRHRMRIYHIQILRPRTNIPDIRSLEVREV